MGEDRPDAAKSPQKGDIKANEQGFQRANDTLNEKNDKKIGNRKKNRSYGEVFQRPVSANTQQPSPHAGQTCFQAETRSGPDFGDMQRERTTSLQQQTD
jgi:hypothetical protein